MKTILERDAYIYDLWATKKKSFKKIAEEKMPGFLSLKTIRNIVYGYKSDLSRIKKGLDSSHAKEIYKIFQLKFLELQDTNAAIRFTYENQPTHFLHEKQIRKIINKKLKKNDSSY